MSKRAIARVVDYQKTFHSDRGKKVLWDLMKTCHVLDSTFIQGDSVTTAFREGERNMVLRILTILKQDPKKMLQQIEQGEQDDDRSNWD